MSEQEEKSRYQIESGYYMAIPSPVRLENGEMVYAQLGLSAQAGTKQVLVMMKLVDHDVSLPWFGYFTPDSAERTIQSLRLLGWKGKSFQDLANAKLEGRVSVTVERDQFKGKWRSRVAWVNDPNGPGIKIEPIDKRDLTALEKDFGSLLK